jgi:murein DD-endopeptidase MepM/ murein hydrolase activator NlpD
MRTRVRETRRKRRTVIAIILCAALLVGIGLGILAFSSRGASSKYTKVPMVEDLTYAAATTRLKSAGLDIDVDSSQDTTGVRLSSKKIAQQTPSSGSNAEKGSVVTVVLLDVPSKHTAPTTTPTTTGPVQTAPSSRPTNVDTGLSAPMDGRPIYPFTKDGSIACGHWPSGSTDYPYFGAPRENGRKHGAIDIYPPTGKGTPVKAVKDGTVVQVIPDFYTRSADGEQCCGILIDHSDFVAFYGEMTSPAALSVGQTVKQGQRVGTVSGTVQLHFEMYTPGTKARHDWYGSQPADLEDPTNMMLKLFGM